MKSILDSMDTIPLSDFVEQIVRLHHKLTVIHPFGDGNGRTLRAFLNLLLIKRKVIPVYIKVDDKDDYLNALSSADGGSYDDLVMIIYKAVIKAHSELTEAPPL